MLVGFFGVLALGWGVGRGTGGLLVGAVATLCGESCWFGCVVWVASWGSL